MEKEQDNSYHKINLNWYPGHMAKAKREIKEKLDFIDIVYEIIDARMPISSRIPLDEFTKNKEKVIIVTKYDLCDKTRTDEILKSLQEKNILTFDLKSSSKQDINNLIKIIISFASYIVNYYNKINIYCKGNVW